MALLDQVLEAARAGDDDVDAARAAPATCGSWPTPPKTVATRRPRPRRAARRARRPGWPARGSAPGPARADAGAARRPAVGEARRPAAGRRRGSCRSRCGRGRARRGRRATSGIVAAWIGNGVVDAAGGEDGRRARAGTPSSAKVSATATGRGGRTGAAEVVGTVVDCGRRGRPLLRRLPRWAPVAAAHGVVLSRTSGRPPRPTPLCHLREHALAAADVRCSARRDDRGAALAWRRHAPVTVPAGGTRTLPRVRPCGSLRGLHQCHRCHPGTSKWGQAYPAQHGCADHPTLRTVARGLRAGPAYRLAAFVDRHAPGLGGGRR